MGAKTNKKSNAGKNVLVFFIVFIILEMLIIFGVGKVFKNKDVTPSIAGYSIYMTDSELKAQKEDGTYETSVPKGALVIASNGLTNAVEKIGSAVLCENVEGQGSGIYWLADVNTTEGEDGVTYTVANGDRYYTIKSSDVVGVTSSYFTTAGKVITFITSKFGMIVCAVVPLFLLVLIELIIAIATHSPEEDEEDEEEEEETKEEVKLDDFLFGGKDEGEQIARHRRQAAEKAEPAEIKTEEKDDSRIYVPGKEKKDEDPLAGFNFDFSKKEEKNEQLTDDSLSLNDDVNMSAYYEKASKLLDEAANETAKPVQKPVQHRPAQRKPRPQAKPTSAANTSATLEDLMKLMEEEQNKLKNQMK